MLKAHVGYLKKKLATLGQTDTFKDPSLPTIYVITPTHTRPGFMIFFLNVLYFSATDVLYKFSEQKAELVRVSQGNEISRLETELHLNVTNLNLHIQFFCLFLTFIGL